MYNIYKVWGSNPEHQKKILDLHLNMWFIKNDKFELKKDTMKIPPNAYIQTLVPPMSFLGSIIFLCLITVLVSLRWLIYEISLSILKSFSFDPPSDFYT